MVKNKDIFGVHRMSQRQRMQTAGPVWPDFYSNHVIAADALCVVKVSESPAESHRTENWRMVKRRGEKLQ